MPHAKPFLQFAVCFFIFFKQKTGNAIRALGRMATLSANSRKTTSAGSSPTKMEFGEELFADVTENVHDFKTMQSVVSVEDRTSSEYHEKIKEMIEKEKTRLNEETDKSSNSHHISVDSDNRTYCTYKATPLSTITLEEITKPPSEHFISKERLSSVQEIDGIVQNELNEKSCKIEKSQDGIEKISNELSNNITESLEDTVTHNWCGTDTTRKERFSSSVNLEITDSRMTEESSKTKVNQNFGVEVSEFNVEWKPKDSEEKKPIRTTYIPKDRDGKKVDKATPVVTKVWCKTINPKLVGVLCRFSFNTAIKGYIRNYID